MKKVFITGNAGSGKSTLGKKIAAQIDAEFFSLDRIVWQERWQKTPMNERRERISQLIYRDKWVIDGVSDQVLGAADQIIFLDFPRRICFYRALKRSSRHLFSSRADLPAHCPEILIIPRLIKVIWLFPKRFKAKILAKKAGKSSDAAFIHITSTQDLKNFLNNS